jgi:hypothetical protein
MPISPSCGRGRCSPPEKGGEAAPPPLEVALAEELLPVTVPEVRRLLRGLVWQYAPPEAVLLHWSWWRRRHQQRAKRCHYRRRLAFDQAQLRL